MGSWIVRSFSISTASRMCCRCGRVGWLYDWMIGMATEVASQKIWTLPLSQRHNLNAVVLWLEYERWEEYNVGYRSQEFRRQGLDHGPIWWWHSVAPGTWASLEKRMVIFSEDGTWTKPLRLEEGEKPFIMIAHDESTFNTNNGERRIWKETGKSPLRPKGRGKGIMVSEFLTSFRSLRIPDCVSDTHLLLDFNWPLDENQKPCCCCTEFPRSGCRGGGPVP